MKKIAFLVSSAATSGGIQKSLSLKAAGLDSQKYSLTIISLFDYEKTTYDFGVNTKIIKGSLQSNTDLKKVFLKAFSESKKLLEAADFDTLVIEGLALVPFVRKKYLIDKSIKIVVVDHTGLNNYNKYGLSWFGLRKTKKYIDELIVLTEENKKEYVRNFKDLQDKVKVIPNSLDPSIKSSSYNEHTKKICFVGRLSHEKGPDLLLESFWHVVNSIENNEWVLDIYGVGPQLDSLKNQISIKELNNRVFLKGYNDNIKSIYKDYAFIVVPSRFESFGLIIIEALKAGIPVVAFDCYYGPRSIIRHRENGLLVANNNIQELSKAIKELIIDKDLRVFLAQNTSKNLKKYEYTNVNSEWEKVL